MESQVNISIGPCVMAVGAVDVRPYSFERPLNLLRLGYSILLCPCFSAGSILHLCIQVTAEHKQIKV
jgi:hypothetical protein